MMGKAVIIGSGLAGLSAACHLAKAGFSVMVLEKQLQPGGRARQLKADGFTFDMGPSWYWMPDVFERFFRHFDQSMEDYYHLQRLSPSYDIYWQDSLLHVPADYSALKQEFEKIEPGSGAKLDEFLAGAEEKYRIGMQQLAYKPGKSILEFADKGLLQSVLKLDIFTSMSRHIARYFTHPRLRQLLSFPVLFLGALPEKIPALYSLMNYADIKLGTWYPQGGIYTVVDAIYRLAMELGVRFHFGEEVTGIEVEQGVAKSVCTQNRKYTADVVIGAADYHFIEQQLLPLRYRTYSMRYWNSRIMAPSCLLYYVGVNKRLPALQHHSLFFDVSFDAHAADIYSRPSWPEDPLFYTCCPSRTDATVAPPGCENLFILIPVAAGLKGDDEALRQHYFSKVMDRLESHLGERIRDNVVYMKSYAGSNFMEDYNAFKGNAYGLANTLNQTALLKPSIRSRKVSNLFYTGQLTAPGPGMPPALISGEIAAREATQEFKQHKSVTR
jgi:phytoene desaturase